ncbi:hypothetical protein AAMO2058_000931200 [Amorphochlora amoebiformis]
MSSGSYRSLNQPRDKLPAQLQRSIWIDNLTVKPMLTGVSGFALPGEILAIMGPSGAGKTTLMDFMAGREMNRFRGITTGCVRINGRKRTRDFVEISGHTQSSPVFLGTLTVKETIDYAACLNICNSSERKARVMSVIRELHLEKCLNTTIGTPLRKGISDGERKRLAIALQLLRKPSILLLDEPTSGLDTRSSRQVISIVRGLADRGYTVAINIHSPDSTIFHQFDRLLMLVAGRVQYFGKANVAVECYEKVCERKRHMFQNPAEFLFECDTTVETVYQLPPDPSELTAPGVNGYHPKDIEKSECSCCFPSDDLQAILAANAARKSRPSIIWQFIILSLRSWRENSRNIAKYHLRAVLYALIGACIGSAWFDLPQTFTTLHDRQTMLMVIIVFYSFMQVASIPSFLVELQVMNREVLDGVYPVHAHMLQSFLSGILPNFLLALFSSWIIFKMVGIGDEGRGYPLFLVNVFLMLYVAESFAEFLCTFLPNLLVALCVFAGYFCISFIAMGLLVPISHLPIWWKPFHFASFHRYSIEVFCWNAFHGWNVECDLWPKYLCRIFRTGDDVLKARDMSSDEEDIILDLKVLLFQAVIYRMLSWMVLSAKTWSNTCTQV